jgi:hypothetical protein
VSDVSCREDYGHAGRRVGPRSVQVPIHALRTQGEEGRIEGREGDAGREAGRRKGRGSGAGVGMGGGGLGALGGGQGVGAIRARTRTLAPLHTCARPPPPCVSTATPTRLVGGRTCHEEDTHEECGERRPGWRGGGGSRGVEDHVGTPPAALRNYGDAEALGGRAHIPWGGHTRGVWGAAARMARRWRTDTPQEAVTAPREYSQRCLGGVVGRSVRPTPADRLGTGTPAPQRTR